MNGEETIIERENGLQNACWCIMGLAIWATRFISSTRPFPIIILDSEGGKNL